MSIYVLDNGYLGNFLIVLAIIECISYYYRRPWWVARQMLSRASGSNVIIEIDEEQSLLEKYGSKSSGSVLGDILGKALDEDKDSKEE